MHVPFAQWWKKLQKPVFRIYPILIILLIPLLLIANTLWNLRSFNRDANFIVRHQAVSIVDTLNPLIQSTTDASLLQTIIQTIPQSNTDVLSIVILKKDGETFNNYVDSGNDYDVEAARINELNQLALSFKEPFAGLKYDPKRAKNVWNVVSPVTTSDGTTYIVFIKLDTKSIEEILSRTSRDSFIILAILIIITIVLLANHFYFYIKALRTRQLEELDQLKDEFISIAAHELRAPMTAMVGYLELIHDKLLPEEFTKIGEYMEVLNKLTRDLNGLINDLLDVSRIEQGRLKIEKKETNVSEIVANVVKTMEPTARPKGLQVIYNGSELPLIQTDPDRLRQVITNLISNAIKYTLKGNVAVETKVDSGNIVVSVKDTGIGIPGEEVQKLFSKFHRVQDEKTRDVKGTGLGLWITKQIVELLGGTIHVESIYGTGTSIIVTLPITKITF